jgi:hypothetical protein
MTRTIHDSFAKECMQSLLADFGDVEVEKPLIGEVRTVDIVFHPRSDAIADRQMLGLLGRMVAKPSLLEPFRNAVPEWEIRNCREKLFQLEGELRRRVKARKQRLKQSNRPFMWILSPTMSPQLQQEFCVKPKRGWGEGIYFLPNPDRTAVVALHQLPRTPDTLWLRLLGRGNVQDEAIAELLALPSAYPYRQETMRHLAMLRIHLQARQNRTKDIQEAVMSLSSVYAKWEQETLAKIRQETLAEGRQEGRQELALKMLEDQKYPLTEIAQLTGFSIAQLESLQGLAR